MRKPKRELPRHGDPNGCPSMECSGGRSGSQHSVSPGQAAAILENTNEPDGAAGSLGERLRTASRCSYCGCVYVRSWVPEERTILGFWDNGVGAPGWHGRRLP